MTTFGDLLYDTSVEGVKNGLATWEGNTVRWRTYEKFADTISSLQEKEGGPVYSVQRSFVLENANIRTLRKSKTQKYTSFVNHNNFWGKYKLNSSNKNPAGTFEFLDEKGEPFKLWDKFLENTNDDAVGLALNDFPFQYTITGLFYGKKSEFLKTFEPSKTNEDYLYQSERATSDLKAAQVQIKILKDIIKKHEATIAASESASLVSETPQNVRLNMVESSIINFTRLLDELKI